MRISISFLMHSLLASTSALLASASTYSEVRGYVWVKAESPSEGHAQACARVACAPTPPSESIDWNSGVIAEVVTALKMKVDMSESPMGVRGCCVPGLWCLHEEESSGEATCFTQAFGTFENHGALMVAPASQISSALPVYSCLNLTSSSTTHAEIDTSSISFENGVLRLQGSGLDDSAADVVISINGSSCYNNERTSEICKPCTSSTTGECGEDGVCLSAGSGAFCYKYCAFEGDASCPSGSFCDTVQISSGLYQITTYVCTVRALDSGSGCRSSDSPADSEAYRCEAPEVYHQTIPSGASNLRSLAISVNSDGEAASATVTVPLTNFSNSCSVDSDCFDHNPCTVDVCDNSSSLCLHDYLDGCESSRFRLRESRYPFTYDVLVRSGMQALQENFTATIASLGTQSSSSYIDDYTPETVDLRMDFNYFGSSFSKVSLNPNGLVAFPPFPDCQGYAGSIYCISYSSFTNAISAWRSDWNPSESSLSGIFFLRQNPNTTSVYGIDDVNAFHVLYNELSKFDEKRTYAKPCTFAVSLYEDGSIRVSYITMSEEIESTDSFGLWASKASSAPSDRSNLRYRSETIEASNIHQGEDIVYCHRAVLACPVRGCVQAGETLQLRWRGSTRCDALDASVSFQCDWVGGAVTTPGVVRGSGNNQTLECLVPNLNVSDASLLTVGISAQYVSHDGEVLSVKLINDEYSGKKSFYAVTENPFNSSTSASGELVRHEVVVRYYISGSSLAPGGDRCGCNPFIVQASAYEPAGSFCDSCFVCRYGVNESAVSTVALREDTVDCNGDCFGAAYIDGCNNCSSGLTSKTPETCGPDGIIVFIAGPLGDGDYGAQIFFVIIVVCCMSCVFSVFLYFARGLFAQRGVTDNIEFILIDGVPIQIVRRSPQETRQNRNGLSEFERDALGEFVYKPMVVVEAAAVEGGSTQSHDSPTSTNECSICLVCFKDGDVCRRLPEPCGHCFHKECVDHWFELSTSCPLCKRSIKTILFGEDAGGSGTAVQPTVIVPDQQGWMIQYLMDRRDMQEFNPTHRNLNGGNIIIPGDSDENYSRGDSRIMQNVNVTVGGEDSGRASAYTVSGNADGASAGIVEMSTRYSSSDDDMI